MAMFHPTTTTYKQGARTLSRQYFVSDIILDKEFKKIFFQNWVCVGRVSSLAKSGDYVLADVAGESLIIIKDKTNTINALFNTCRHRGTKICIEECGHFNHAIQCDYHAWTYATDGSLIAAPYMDNVKGFNKKKFGLHKATIAIWEGFIFVNISPNPKPFATVWKDLQSRLSRFYLNKLQVGRKIVYDVAANWKLVFQNYNECLHCPTIHPKLSTVLPYKSGANDLVNGKFLGGYMEIKEPNVSATMSGRACGVPISGTIPKDDMRRAYYYSFMPNMLLSIHPDYVNYYLIKPVSTNRTQIVSEWLFPEATLADPKNNIQDAVEFWDMTNRQDWEIIERSQMGISSTRYVPGPYSPRESIPAAWDREYLRMMK